jgi:predicted DsbA family dithiol-disulfide isomerase
VRSVKTYLKTEEDLEWVITIDLFWKEQQTEGLPFFVFNDKYVVPTAIITTRCPAAV